MRVLTVMLSFLIALQGSTGAWAETPNPRDLLQIGTLEAGFVTGYLQGFDTRPSVSNDRGALYVLPRLGAVVSGELGRGHLLGRLQLLAEPLYARYFRPFGATAAGGSLLFKYNLVTLGPWVPYLDAGAGLLWSDLPPALNYGSPFNFVLQVGSGFQYFVAANYALTLGVRFHHISNAGTGERNVGLNGILAYIGIVLFRSQ
jgi:lipid A 3-O-deacylase